MPFNPQRFDRMKLMILVALTIASLIIFALSIALFATKSCYETKGRDRLVPSLPDEVMISANILRHINPKVDPCDNFYEFSNGNSIEREMLDITSFRRRNIPTIAEIQSIVPRLVSKVEKLEYYCESEYKVILFYNMCMVQGTEETEAKSGIFGVIQFVDLVFKHELDFDVFGHQDISNLAVRHLFQWYEMTSQKWLTQKNLFFSIIASQTSNNGRPFVFISPTISSETLYQVLPVLKNGTIAEHALNYIIESVIEFHGLSQTVKVFRAETLKVVQEFVTIVTSLTDDDLNSGQNPEENQFEIPDDQKQLWLAPFEKYGSLLPNQMVGKNFSLRIKNCDYFQFLHGNDFLDNLKLYYLIQYISALHLTLMQTNFTYSSYVTETVTSSRERQIKCVKELSDIPIMQQILNTAFMKLYMGFDAFEFLEKVANETRSAAKQIVNKIDELTTQEKVKELIDQIQIHPSKVDENCGNMETKFEDFHIPGFGANEYIHFWHEVQNFYQNIYGNQGSLWQNCCPFARSSYYDYNSKKVSISSFYLNQFYSASLPEPLKYAFFGSIIGEGIFHSLDPSAIKDLSLQNMLHWNSETKQVYEKFVSCLVHVHNELNVNGNSSLFNNFANFWGLRVAFKSFQANKDSKSSSKIFPGFESYSAEQLFFIGWAQRFRTISVNNFIDSDSDDDVDFPDWIRVNKVLSMNPEFAKTYGCQQNDRMVSSHECNLWT